MKLLKTAVIVAALALPAAQAQESETVTATQTPRTVEQDRGFDWGWLGLLGLLGLTGLAKRDDNHVVTTTTHR